MACWDIIMCRRTKLIPVRRSNGITWSLKRASSCALATPIPMNQATPACANYLRARLHKALMQYTVQRQLSVAIENQPGRLAAITRVMASHGINIKDISVVDNVEQGMIRMVTSDAAGCKALLVKEGFYVVEADVLVFILKDSPGQLG